MLRPSASPVSLSERLQTATEALASAQTQEAAFQMVLASALGALGAAAGAAVLVADGGLKLAAVQGAGVSPHPLWSGGLLDLREPVEEALAQRSPLFLPSSRAATTAVLPMLLDGQSLGAVILGFAPPHSFSAEEQHFLSTLGVQCAVALGRAQLLTSLREELTRRQQTEQDLRRSEARFRRMVEASPVAMAAGDLSGQLILVNRAYLKLLGYTRAEFEAGELDRTSLTPPEYHSADRRAYEQALACGACDPYDKEMLTRTGERVPLNLVLIRYDEGEETLVVGYLQDQRLQRAAAAVLREHTAELERQVAARTQELEGSRAQAQTLAALGDVLQRATSPEEVAALALESLGPALRAQSMLVVGVEGEGVRLPTLWGETPEVITAYMARPGLRLSDTPILQRAAQAGHGVYLEDDRAEPSTLASSPALASGVEPIVLPGGTLEGFVVTWRSTALGPWQAGERDLLRQAARTLGLALERAKQARRLEEERAALDAFVAFTEASAGTTDVLTLAQHATQVVRTALDDVSVVFYEAQGALWKARVWSGDVAPAVVAQIRAGVSQAAPVYAQALRERAPVFSNHWDAEANGLPSAREYGAVALLPLFTQGAADRLLAVGIRQSHVWTEREQATVRAVAHSLGLALERAEQTRQLEEERASLDAYVAFNSAVGADTDEITLASRAVDVLRVRFADCSSGYYQRDGELWKLRIWTADLEARPEFLALLRAGLPSDTPFITELLRERAPTFTEAWDAEHEQIEGGEVYGTVGAYPVMVDGEVRGFVTVGLKAALHWSERDRAIFRSVGRSLDLALERAKQTARQSQQTAELDARTRALEGFANLTRDLSVEMDPYILVQRAQAVALSLLPEGYALYFEPQGGRWVLRGQTGDLRSEALQAVADAGLPYHEANNLLIPYDTLAPYYQDQYARDTDNLDDMVAHLGASATLPVVVNGRARGVFAVVLFGRVRHWTRPDQAALESVVRSLGLALERAESLGRLEARTQEVVEWRERYEVAVRGSGHLLYDWDPVSDAILYGGAVEQITGYTVQELDGNLADWTARLIHPDDRDGFSREIARVIASSDEFHHAFRVVRRDGTVAEVEDDGYFKRGPGGEVTRMVGFVKDVTERKRAERALLHANEDLRRSNTELEQFAYVASHDLQAPIRAVTSFAGLIDQRYGEHLDGRGRVYLRQIVENGQHMKRLVDDLLAFSRVHTQQQPLLPVDADLVMATVAQRLQSEVDAADAQVTWDTLPEVLADQQQLDQLLQNLISNGLKYRREGVLPEVHLTAQRDESEWRFAVQDNGIGIEAQYFDRIFVIFQRLHGREAYDGTGIGLAVCKKIVERHGGQLWLDSTPGQGSTFFFTLPAVDG